MKWKQCVDDPAFIFCYFLRILHHIKTISPSPLYQGSKLASQDGFQEMIEYYFFPVSEIEIYEVSIKKVFFTENVFLLVNNNW